VEPVEIVEKPGRVCLTLKVGETVQIGDDVLVYVRASGGHGTGGKHVKLSITAPKSKKVYRHKNNDSSNKS